MAASGLSERTFYRYFPTNAESVRPFLDAGSRRFADCLAAHLSRDFECGLDAIELALQEAFVAVHTPWSHHLMQLVLTTPVLRRVWLEANEELAGLLRPTLADALGLPPTSPEAYLAADEAVLITVSSVRRMVHLQETPHEAVQRVSTAFRSAPLCRQRSPE